MRNIQLAKAAVFALVASVLAAGCATTPKNAPPVKEDAAAAARSQAYMDSLVLIPVTGALSDAKPCVVPSAAEKLGSGQVSGPSKDWQTLVQHANTCVKAKSWATLESLASAIARMDIDSPWGAYFLSVAAEGRNELQRALWMADLAQKKSGGRSGLLAYQKGRIFFKMKETTRAMKEIERAVAMDATLAEGHFFLGEIHQRDLEFDQAAKSYAKAIAIDPKHFDSLVGMAEVMLQQNKGEEAASYYQRAVAVQPSRLQAWLRLAYVYETVQKNTVQALNTYKGMKSSIDSGQLRDRPSFDLSSKIKDLQESLQPRVPAQAQAKAAKPSEDKKSVK
jgi:tetratricopeptide (TPR) repeat protein